MKHEEIINLTNKRNKQTETDRRKGTPYLPAIDSLPPSQRHQLCMIMTVPNMDIYVVSTLLLFKYNRQCIPKSFDREKYKHEPDFYGTCFVSQSHKP